jgi:hypothetical protein
MNVTWPCGGDNDCLPKKLMGVLLPSVNHMLANGLQLFVDSIGSDDVRSERVLQSKSQCTNGATLHESVDNGG